MDDLIKVDNENAIIDYSSKESFDEREKEAFKGLSPLLNIVQEIQTTGLYKFVYTPKGTVLKNPDGSIFPIFQENGKFTGPGKMKEVEFDFYKFGKTFASQSLLLYISYQLNDVLEKLESLENEFEIDRKSKIRSCIEEAEYHDYKFNEQSSYIALESELLDGIHAIEDHFLSKMKKIPNPNASIFQNWTWGSKTTNNQNAKFISDRNSNMYWIMRGYKSLIRLYEADNLIADNRVHTEKIFESINSFLSSIDYAELIECSRSLPYNSQYVPEKLWKVLEIEKDNIPNYFEKFTKISSCNSLELRLNGKLLKELKDENGK